jgi:gluconokinase
MGDLVVVMGVSGSGKSTVGAALALRLDVPYVDADDLHSTVNISKMTAGESLGDADRRPWLDDVGRWLADHLDGGVVSCSALRRRYRDQVRGHVPAGLLAFVHLEVEPAVVRRRLAARADHFMPVSLLESQLATLEPLEPDERGVVVDSGQDLDACVAQCVAGLV